MKSLKNFKKEQLSNKQLTDVKGGVGREALKSLDFGPSTIDTGAFIDDNYTYEDTWTDNDGNGEISPGDVICYN